MITLTETAANHVKKSIDKRGKGLGLKLGVRTSGCSGIAYVLEFVDDSLPMDEFTVYESNGVSVWVDHKSAPFLQGLTMNWQKKGLNEGFEFINPNEQARCGCGESFTV